MNGEAVRPPHSRDVQRLPGVPLVPLGFEPDPASLAPVLFVVPERLIPPVEGPLPAAPGDEPEPASFGPVLFAVPERLEPPAPLSVAKAVLPRARMAATTSSDAFISVLPLTRLPSASGPLGGTRVIVLP